MKRGFKKFRCQKVSGFRFFGISVLIVNYNLKPDKQKPET
ncbi:MAG: hypothetical protein AVDCRST_MAG74-1820 [uncultured Pyrinomonadaceae bacterium]|uniref:Uncharacterized protein n=1 Tax=uncultured Pyrinomonadaceae bacterium TaxID=2283094 RepID=A0A6J4P682_9BACT|nr:MAG: hypothetical protein AVDCRST_MAG74-1820 [uncultured Pyrinomonadaceae bacterium]